MKKKHKHKWESDGDSCFHCGAYIEYCQTDVEKDLPEDEYCYATRETVNGKSKIIL